MGVQSGLGAVDRLGAGGAVDRLGAGVQWIG